MAWSIITSVRRESEVGQFPAFMSCNPLFQARSGRLPLLAAGRLRRFPPRDPLFFGLSGPWRVARSVPWHGPQARCSTPAFRRGTVIRRMIQSRASPLLQPGRRRTRPVQPQLPAVSPEGLPRLSFGRVPPCSHTRHGFHESSVGFTIVNGPVDSKPFATGEESPSLRTNRP